jgi:hypothetical protein
MTQSWNSVVAEGSTGLSLLQLVNGAAAAALMALLTASSLLSFYGSTPVKELRMVVRGGGEGKTRVVLRNRNEEERRHRSGSPTTLVQAVLRATRL